MIVQRFKTAVLGVAVATLVGGAAFAGDGFLEFFDTNAWGQGGGGGPFLAEGSGFTGQNAGANGKFLTFCVEKNEGIGVGPVYDADVNTAAVNGGQGGGNPDPLDEDTAWLYTAFRDGTLSSFDIAGIDFSYGDALSGRSLQQAIWSIEEETTGLTAMATALKTLASTMTASGSAWDLKYGAGGIGNVRILNLTLNGVLKQDQLVLIPLPIPAAMALVGLLGVGVVSHRRRRLGC